MASLWVELLGGVRLRLASGAAVTLPTRKSRSLLAYLALATGPQPRARLAELLWSDRAEAQARGSLRQELHLLRQALAGADPPAFHCEGEVVLLDTEAAAVDVLAFERLAGNGDRNALEHAVALYRGDLLAGLTVRAPAFEDWLSFERQRLRGLAIEACGRLLELQMTTAVATDEAAVTARRLLELDQAHEGAHRALMRILARAGDRNAALRQYQLCRSILARELGVEPEQETEQLHRALMHSAANGTRGPDPANDLPLVPGRTTQPIAIRSGMQPSRTESSITALAAAADAATERRQLAVAFVDLVDSTTLATRKDPEELREVLRAFHRTVAQAVARFGGRVILIHVQGDGLLACFGWPRAYENDAERAVRAALAGVAAVADLRLSGVGRIACRAGIATGVVVIGKVGNELDVVGETPHLAARLHAVGPPGAVMVAEDTRRLLGELFAYESLGTSLLKGFAAPVAAWRVLSDRSAASRFAALRGASLTPLLGRRREFAFLLDRWRLAQEGEGQVVLLTGEAGIGKSRLIAGLRERLVDDRHTPVALYCSPHHSNSELFPVLRLLERAAGLRHDDPPERQLEMLQAMLAVATAHARDHAALLADLLNVPEVGRYPRQDELTPQRRKEQTFQVLLQQLDGLLARGPVLVLCEDVHWADPTTLELLDQVIDRVRRRSVLLIATFRPEFAPPWASDRHVSTLSLGRLDRGPAAALVGEVIGGETLSPELVASILERADGVPLFLEELTRAVLASTAVEAVPLVPATLQGSLLAQLDRLPEARNVAQVAAVIGREFPYNLLAATAGRPEEELGQALDQLVAAGICYGSMPSGHETYMFRHALLRDAAYESLLKSRRRELHSRVAEVVERNFPQVVADEPELLAHHLAQAGKIGPAIEYRCRAGERAVRRFANAEAISHFREALRLLTDLPDGPERDSIELLIQAAIGVPLMAAKGYSAPEIKQAYARARKLCRTVSPGPALPPILFGLCTYYLVGSELTEARSLAAQCLRLARRTKDADFLMEACCIAGPAELYAGKLVAARALLDCGLALYRPERHRDHAGRYGQDPLVALAFIARVHALLGRPDLARQRASAILVQHDS